MGGNTGVLNRSAANRAPPPLATTVTIGPARPTPNAAAPQSRERAVAQQDPEQIGRHPIDDSGTPRRIVLVGAISKGLDVLVARGAAVMVLEKPRTFQAPVLMTPRATVTATPGSAVEVFDPDQAPPVLTQAADDDERGRVWQPCGRCLADLAPADGKLFVAQVRRPMRIGDNR